MTKGKFRKHILMCLNSVQPRLASLPAHAFERLQSQTQEELDALLPSMLRPSAGAFKGEL